MPPADVVALYSDDPSVEAAIAAKSLALLKREGLVETGYRQIRVPDRARLRRWLSAQEPD